ATAAGAAGAAAAEAGARNRPTPAQTNPADVITASQRICPPGRHLATPLLLRNIEVLVSVSGDFWNRRGVRQRMTPGSEVTIERQNSHHKILLEYSAHLPSSCNDLSIS
ncbi:MAG: hypothetical protein M3Y35_08080, partial [Actinomycetota bacterium]|nr:hypothetical protein [Actinomycetota bacterium]